MKKLDEYCRFCGAQLGAIQFRDGNVGFCDKDCHESFSYVPPVIRERPRDIQLHFAYGGKPFNPYDE
jgi:hypothetical protein